MAKVPSNYAALMQRKKRREQKAKNSSQTKPQDNKMNEANEEPVGVHVDFHHPKTNKKHRETFMGTHQAVAAAKKHISNMEKKGYKVAGKSLAYASDAKKNEAVEVANGEQLDELSADTLDRYMDKASASYSKASQKPRKNKAVIDKRRKGINRAMDRLDVAHTEMEGNVLEESTIHLGGERHPMRRVPIKHHDEYKAKFPGSRVKFRGPKKGKRNTSKADATHFYIVNHKDPIGTQDHNRVKLKEELDEGMTLDQAMKQVDRHAKTAKAARDNYYNWQSKYLAKRAAEKKKK